VAFGSGLHAWAFSLRSFALMYAAKMGVDPDKLVKRFWGDNYYDQERTEQRKRTKECGSKSRG